jgi:hypothetical protein
MLQTKKGPESTRNGQEYEIIRTQGQGEKIVIIGEKT